jgi:hypothetical protein
MYIFAFRFMSATQAEVGGIFHENLFFGIYIAQPPTLCQSFSADIHELKLPKHTSTTG